MKVAIFVTVFAVSVIVVQGKSSPEFKNKVRPLAEECRKKVTSTDKDIEDVLNIEENSSEDAKCISKCIQETVGFLKNDEYQSYEILKPFYSLLVNNDEEKLKKGDEILQTCRDKAIALKTGGASICEASYSVSTCVTGLI